MDYMAVLEKYMGTWLFSMMTNEPLYFILLLVGIGVLFQAFMSWIVLAIRKQILIDDYGYNMKQVMGFYWKSVIFFPVTWFLLVKEGLQALWRRIRNR